MARFFNAALSDLYPTDRDIPLIRVGAGQRNQPYALFWQSSNPQANPTDRDTLDEGASARTRWITLVDQPGTNGVPDEVTVTLEIVGTDVGSRLVGADENGFVTLDTFNASNYDTRTSSSGNRFQIVADEDDDADAHLDFLAIRSPELGLDTIPVRVIDDEAGVVVENLPEVIIEGQMGFVDVSLSGRPLDTVSVHVSSSNTGAIRVAHAFPFAFFTTETWNIPVTMTLESVADSDTVDETALISFNPSGSPGTLNGYGTAPTRTFPVDT